MSGQPELITGTDLDAEICTVGGTEHDYKPHAYYALGRNRISLRCVWCHAVACGDVGEVDPCIEPYHHAGDHRTKASVTWRKGACRPDQEIED
jgi:hypothetical protein